MFRKLQISKTRWAIALWLLAASPSLGVPPLICPWGDLTPPPLPGSDFRYIEAGSRDKPTVVLLHGLESFSGTFRPILKELSKDYHVIALDQRGNGATPAAGDNYSNSALARDVKLVLDHLGIEKVHILGHSLGGRVATRFAERYPERTRSLIVEDMDLFQRRNVTEAHKAELKELVQNLRRDFQDKNFQSASELAHALSVYFGPKEAELMAYRQGRKNPDGTVTFLVNPDVSFLFATMSSAENLGPSLQRIKAPILAIRADPRLRASMTEPGEKHLMANAPHAQVETVSTATHAVHRSQPKPYLDLVSTFLEHGSIPMEKRGQYAPKTTNSHLDLGQVFTGDTKTILTKLRPLKAEHLSPDQMTELIRRTEGEKNPFLLRELIRIAGESNQSRWTDPLSRLLHFMIENNPGRYAELIPQARRIRNHMVYEHHIEHQFPQFATRGSYYSAREAKKKRIPTGAAMHVALEKAAPRGNRSLILANTNGFWPGTEDYVTSPELARLAVNNVIHLARKQGLRSLDMVFTGKLNPSPEVKFRQRAIVGEAVEEIRKAGLPIQVIVSTRAERQLFESVARDKGMPELVVKSAQEVPPRQSDGAVWVNADRRHTDSIPQSVMDYVDPLHFNQVRDRSERQLGDFSNSLLEFLIVPPKRARGLGDVTSGGES